MKKTALVFLIGIITFSGFKLNAQTLEEILDQHAIAMGYDKLAEVKTIRIDGENYFGERTMPFKIIIKNPDKYYSERDFMGRKMIQVIDGENAWSLNPMRGLSDIKGSQLEMLKRNAVFGGLLHKWQEKGFKLKLEDRGEFEGTEVFKILIEDPEENVSEIYLDAESFITLKQVSKRVFEGNDITATKIFSNYKSIEGIAVAFNEETESDRPAEGRGGRRMGGGTRVITSIVFNAEVNDSIFKKLDTTK